MSNAHGACVALDAVTKLCTIYRDASAVCREFERGSGLCRDVLVPPAIRADNRSICGNVAAVQRVSRLSKSSGWVFSRCSADIFGPV